MSFNPLSTQVDGLLEDSLKSYLNADIASGSGTITVENIANFAVNQILLLGALGAEKSEIIKTHASSAPSGSTITLASNTLFTHQAGSPVTILDYDQVEISHASTISGGKSVVTTIPIQADNKATLYTDTTYSSGYFFVRFKNSISTTYSDYTDPIPVSGFDENTVAKAIDYAMNRNGKKVFSETVNLQFCIDEVNNCLDDMRGMLARWPSLQEFNYNLGTLESGENQIDVPTDAYQYSPRSFLGVRIDGQKNLTYIDKADLVKELDGVFQTAVTSTTSSGSTTLVLNDVSALDDSGTIYAAGQYITYTGRNTGTNTLSGIPASGDGSITATLTAGDSVWKNPSVGQPLYWTIIEGQIIIWPLAGTDLVGRKLLADYWKEAPSVDSDGDTLDIYRFRAVRYWLTWAIRCQIKKNGERDLKDADYKLYLKTSADAMKNEGRSGQRFRWQPALNKMKM